MTKRSDELRSELMELQRNEEKLIPELRDDFSKRALEKFAGEIMGDMADFVNWGDERELGKALADGLQRQHRTLQASVIRSLLIMFKEYGSTKFFDLRNEGAVKAAKQIGDGEYNIPFV